MLKIKNIKVFTSVLLLSTTLHAGKTIPIDSNLELGNEKGILYYVDPRSEEGGENRALRINYENMSFEEIGVDGINPHSIDRAGESDKFYIRTQNSYSFDVVNFKDDTVKTVPLDDHKPRAIGAYNNKYKIQLLSALDMPLVDVINTRTDEVIATVGDRNTFNSANIQSNGGGAGTGHAVWLTRRYFVLVDRVNAKLKLYKVFNKRGKFSVHLTDVVTLPSAVHAIEKIKNPKIKDKFTFYAMGEGDVGRVTPFVVELKLDRQKGKRGKLKTKITYLRSSTKTIDGVKPATHHAGISPDKKYLIVPVYDGKIYIIERNILKVIKVLDTKKLGAGHIEFSKSRNLAIVTNHFSKDITIIDMKTLSIKKILTISHHRFDPSNKHLLQPHFSHISENGKYFYTFATQDGDFHKIDLDTLEIVDTLHTGGAPEQAHS